MNAILTIDAAGRLVLPKPIRDLHSLGPGSELELTDDGTAIHLRPVTESPPVREVNGFLVYTGRAAEAGVDAVQRDRHARLRRVAGSGG
jgi:AbrB family looped-hinge helix DNA binding protein